MFHNPLFFSNNVESSVPIGTPFIFTVSADPTFTLPLDSTGTYNFTVDWGDSTSNTITSYSQPTKTHTYSSNGSYTVSITGMCNGWIFNNTGDCLKMRDISQWGTSLVLGTNQGGYFYGCANMNITAIDYPVMTGVTSLANCFRNCTSLNSSNLSGWDVSNITNMSNMFNGATIFNNGQVTTISTITPSTCSTGGTPPTTTVICPGATLTGNLAVGDKIYIVTSVGTYIRIVSTIPTATTFTIPVLPANISVGNIYNIMRATNGTNPLNWNTSNVTDISEMFFNARLFNQTLNWNLSLCTTFNSTFLNCHSFNNGDLYDSSTKPLDWVTSNVTNTFSMFSGAYVFNQPIIYDSVNNYWNTSNVINMNSMFSGATRFNQNISNWDTSNVTNMSNMFNNSTLFNNGQITTISTVDPLACTYNNNSPFTFTCPGANLTSNLVSGDVLYIITNSIVSNRNGLMIVQVNNVTSTTTFTVTKQLGTSIQQSGLIYNISKINNIPNVTPLTSSYVNSTRTLTCPGATFLSTMSIGDSLLLYVNSTPYNTTVASIVNDTTITISTSLSGNVAAGNFRSISKSPLGTNPLNWNTDNVNDMSNMFNGAFVFNQNMSRRIDGSNIYWDFPIQNNITGMFQNAYGFNNGDLPFGNVMPLFWNTSNITDMSNLFNGARMFNQYVGNWDTSGVTNMTNMFQSAFSFNNSQITTLPTINKINLNSVTSGSTIIQCIGAVYGYSLTVDDVVFLSTNQISAARSVSVISDNVSTLTSISTLTVTPNITLSTNTTINISKPVNIPTITLATASYDNTTNTLTCPGATLTTTTLSIGDTLYIYANSITYTPIVATFTDTTITFVTPLGVSIASPNIKTISEAPYGIQPLNWDTSKVTNMSGMFQNAYLFNQNMSNFNTALCTDISNMFNSSFEYNNGDYTNTSLNPINWGSNTSALTTINSAFSASRNFNQSMNNWNVSNITSMSNLFFQASNYNNANQSLTWNPTKCIDFSGMFRSATTFNRTVSNLVDTSTLPTSNCTLANMFNNATIFNQSLSTWKTVNVSDMSSLFNSATTFNQPLTYDVNGWNTSNVTNMNSMFSNMPYNNASISTWITSNVTTTSSMFSTNASFNQNIGSWNLSKVVNMSSMFFGASAFNNGGSNTISNWSVPLCFNFSNAFRTASFNQPLTNLVNPDASVISITFAGMFNGATIFNQNISGWNVSKAIDMSSMFQSTTAFNNGGVSLSSWTAPLCTTFASMFLSATNFNQSLTNLVKTAGTTNVTCAQMFSSCGFNNDTSGWDTSNVTTMQNMFNNPACRFNHPSIGGWNVGNVTTMTGMFNGNTSFNQNIGSWNTGKVTTMSFMFQNNNVFNNGGSNTINNWDVSNVINFQNMFTAATAFNQPIGNWNIGSSPTVTTISMASMFAGTNSFNQNIGYDPAQPTRWNLSKVTNMSNMFQNNSVFNNGGSNTINNWNVSNVTTFASMFSGATAFNQPVGNWNTSSATTMSSMFNMSTTNQGVFNNGGTSPLNWNTSKVTNMSSMFRYCTNFNQVVTYDPVNNYWNTNLVTTFSNMFEGASATILHKFNNGQAAGGTTAPMGWLITGTPLSTNWRNNCNLTTANKPAGLP